MERVDLAVLGLPLCSSPALVLRLTGAVKGRCVVAFPLSGVLSELFRVLIARGFSTEVETSLHALRAVIGRADMAVRALFKLPVTGCGDRADIGLAGALELVLAVVPLALPMFGGAGLFDATEAATPVVLVAT